MSGIFLRWGVPALITVVGGTFAAITTSGAAIPTDLAARSNAALGTGWASVRFDMRDATLTGTAANQQMVDDALAQLAEVHGVRSIDAKVELADVVSPFPLLVSVTDGVPTLSGGLPDEAARAQLLELAGQGSRDELRVLAGAPQRDTWLGLARFAVEAGRRLDTGEVTVADSLVTISGRAASSEAYQYLAALKSDSLPSGSILRFGRVEPPVASPYAWRAEYDGSAVTLSGYVPSDAAAAQLAGAIPASVPVSTSVALASGAPADFTAKAKVLLQNLVKLESGSAEISSTESNLSGTAADAETGKAVRVAVTAAGGTATLATPEAGTYRFAAEKKDGRIVLDGLVPDVGLRNRLAGGKDVDAAGVELRVGAPDRFEAGVDFVMDALERLGEGTASIDGNVISVAGRASTLADYKSLEARLKLGAPQGLTLGATSIRPPLASPFAFGAEKSAGGIYALSGNVPDEATRAAVAKALPQAPVDRLALADGAPAGFEAEVTKAVDVLALLDSGRVGFDGNNWSIAGAVGSEDAAAKAKEAFAAAGFERSGSTLDLTVPVAAKPAVLPQVEAYAWRAQKAADGTVTLTGYVPTEQLQRYLVAHVGGKAVDETSLASGAPEGFIDATIAALDALAGLDDGAVSYSDGKWSLSGNVASIAKRRAVEAALGKVPATAGWQVAIQAADAPPVVSPFTWSAVKSAAGYSFSGYVPTDQLRRFLAVRAGTVVEDTSQIGSGEPESFIPDVLAGLDALASLESGELSFDGKSWSVSGQPATTEKLAAAKAALQSAPGKGEGWSVALAEPLPQPAVVTAVEPPATGEQPVAAEPEAAKEVEQTQTAEAAPQPEIPVVHDYRFEAQKAPGGSITFEGSVPAEAMRKYLAVISGTEPSAALTVRPGMPPSFIDSANAGTRALALLADGRFGLNGDKWVFTGRAETDADRRAALAALSAAPDLGGWQLDVSLLPQLGVCKDKVGTFATRNAILFQSGSAKITDASLPALDELAGYLALCPEVTVNVEGHTDGDGDASANLALSVSRAEAVVDALILRGIDPERLYAIGYGESLPIASNDTKAGKQANRRIAFSLSED